MTNKEKVYRFIQNHNKATNEEIESNLNLPPGNARVYIWKLRNEGLIEINESGEFVILESYPTLDTISSSINKRDLYMELIENYMDEFKKTVNFEDKMRIGRELRLLIEKL